MVSVVSFTLSSVHHGCEVQLTAQAELTGLLATMLRAGAGADSMPLRTEARQLLRHLVLTYAQGPRARVVASEVVSDDAAVPSPSSALQSGAW